MAHLFNKNQYYEYQSKLYTNIKKSLEAKIELMTDQVINLHPIEHTQEIIDGDQIKLTYNGQNFQLPLKLLQNADLSEIVNMKNIQAEFDQNQIEELYDFLPERSLECLQYALTGKGLYEHHLKGFQRKLTNGYFTNLRQKEDQINQRLNEARIRQIYQGLLKSIIHQRNINLKNQKFKMEDQGSQIQSLNDLSDIEDMSQNSQGTQTEQQMEDFFDQEFPPRVFFRYDHGKVKGQQQLLALGEDKIDRKAVPYKITLPARPKNSDWVQNYRRQQFQRYSNPTKPWVYNCQDTRKVTVAPVAKKLSVLTGKPRDHPLLKSQRPACVTILTLVRDAAARLPNGVGTRADISQLLKESQYVNEDLPQEKLSNIVSGALDRLHYMTDACVKYDSQKKLWLYLHSDRNYEHPGWGQDGEDYLDNRPSKRKRRQFE